MKVAIDVSPLKSAHRFRGIGSYTRNLIKALKELPIADFRIKLVERVEALRGVDLVHYPYFDPFFLTLPLKKSQKTVVTIHDVIPLLFPKQFPPGIKGRIKHQIQKLSLKSAAAVITDSQSSKKDIAKYLSLPREKIFVVYLAAGGKFRPIKSTIMRRRIRAKYQLPKRFVLYVGDVNYHKNVIGLVKACKKIKVPLVVISKQAVQKDFDRTHVENQPLVQLLDQYGKDPEVLRLGFLPDKDLVALYNLASVYCQPSFYEGFGLPVLEAMACGTPVVSSSQGSLPEVVGKAAMMVDPYDINDIARGLKRVLESEKLKTGLVKKGFTQAKKFSWQKTARETYEVYRKVARKK